mmetsp:Transcript_56464/g.115552  ORF Transcript_56464/g.115552 Transcript_56464/m.115552 type:complete len:200 (+) Transcript_56464:172-771(+)
MPSQRYRGGLYCQEMKKTRKLNSTSAFQVGVGGTGSGPSGARHERTWKRPALVTNRTPLYGLYFSPVSVRESILSPEALNMTILKSTRRVGPLSGVSEPGTSDTDPLRLGLFSLGTFPISQRKHFVASSKCAVPWFTVRFVVAIFLVKGTVMTTSSIVRPARLDLGPTMMLTRPAEPLKCTCGFTYRGRVRDWGGVLME